MEVGSISNIWNEWVRGRERERERDHATGNEGEAKRERTNFYSAANTLIHSWEEKRRKMQWPSASTSASSGLFFSLSSPKLKKKRGLTTAISHHEWRLFVMTAIESNAMRGIISHRPIHWPAGAKSEREGEGGKVNSEFVWQINLTHTRARNGWQGERLVQLDTALGNFNGNWNN